MNKQDFSHTTICFWTDRVPVIGYQSTSASMFIWKSDVPVDYSMACLHGKLFWTNSLLKAVPQHLAQSVDF